MPGNPFVREGGQMGAWGAESFQNDDAADWLAALGTMSPDDLMQVFSAVADDSGYVEVAAASIAIAAAEVIAAVEGRPATGAPTKILEWTRKNRSSITPGLKALSIRALDRVWENSELKELWSESEEFSSWTAAIQDLRSRLS
jgi:hypothetical protein